MASIDNKKRFYELWNTNLLGNKLRSWSCEEFRTSGYDGVFGLRATPKAAGGGGFLLIPEDRNFNKALNSFKAKGYNESEIVICEAAPDEQITLQGELLRDVYGWYMFALEDHPGLRMREALLLAKEYRGLKVLNLLKQHLTPNSYDDTMELFDIYPDSVIEFSAYRINLGWAAGRNTIIWEVRNY